MKENRTLYFFQGIASILVVFIHSTFPGNVGVVIAAIGRIAVPLFFMISGFSLYKYIETNHITDKVSVRLRRNALTTVYAMAVYALVDVLKGYIKHEPITYFFKTIFDKTNLLKLIFLGVMPPGTGGVLWFMIALVYIYMIMYFIARFIKIKNLYYYGIISFIIMVVAGIVKIISTAYNLSVGDLYLGEVWLYGNWLLIGFPSFFIGLSLAQIIETNQNKIKKYIKISWIVMTICLLLFSIESILLKSRLDMYLSYSVFTLIADVCVFFISSVTIFLRENLFIKIGKYYSKDLYLWHPIIMSMVSIVLQMLKLTDNIYVGYLRPVIVLVLSIALSVIIYQIKERGCEKNHG